MEVRALHPDECLKILHPADHEELIKVMKELDAKLAADPEGSVTLIIKARGGRIMGTRFEIDRAWAPA